MKPRVYGFCDAGCKRETILKEDFDRIASVIKQVPNANGTYILNPFNSYKVHTTKADGSYQATFTLQGNGVDYWFDYTEVDEYRDYIIFEILSLSLNEAATELTIVYEINGNRYIDIYTDNDTVFNLDGVELQIINATDVYSFNNNAQIEACVQIRGIDTYYDQVQELKADEYGVRWTDQFALENADGDNITTGDILHSVPIVAGTGVSLEKDEENNVVKINAAGASGGTTLNKYTVTTKSPKLLTAIYGKAKGRVRVVDLDNYAGCEMAVANASLRLSFIMVTSGGKLRVGSLKIGQSATSFSSPTKKICDIDLTTGTITEETSWNPNLEVVYYNDSEITV